MCRGCVLARVQIWPVPPSLHVRRSKATKMPLKKVVQSEQSRSISSPVLNTSGNLPFAPFHSGLKKKNLLTPVNIWLLSSEFKWLCITGIYRLQLWSADTWCHFSNTMSWRLLNVCELRARLWGFWRHKCDTPENKNYRKSNQSESPTERFCKKWRNSLKVLLRYCILKNGTDRSMDRLHVHQIIAELVHWKWEGSQLFIFCRFIHV